MDTLQPQQLTKTTQNVHRKLGQSDRAANTDKLILLMLHILALTYLLTPWSRVLLEKLASLQLVKKFPVFYGTRRFLTALTSARHLSLS